MENRAGALSRVVGLFSARGFNIENLNVAPTQDETISRLTLVTYCDEKLIEQINKQLNKLIEVIKLVNLGDTEFVDREMLLIKINVDAKSRGQYLQLAEAFRARIIAITPSTGVTGLAATGTGKCLIL